MDGISEHLRNFMFPMLPEAPLDEEIVDLNGRAWDELSRFYGRETRRLVVMVRQDLDQF